MGKCKKDVTPLLTHWSYVFLALTHRYVLLVAKYFHININGATAITTCITVYC